MCTIQSKLKRILALPLREKEVPLRKLAQDLGCNLNSTYTTTQSGNDKHLEEEVVRRIQEAARFKRESSLWLIALISAIASVISALAAWFAVWGQK